MASDNQRKSISLAELERRYRDRNDESERLFEQARTVLPGGDTRSVTYTQPYPTFIDEASGCRMTTVDGDEVIDFLNNYTQAIHGHAPEDVVEVMTDRIRKGNGLGSPTKDVIDLAERLVDRFPSIEQVRFGNSGTEATMNAIRAAIAYTERDRVLKVAGGYHGTHDTVEIGISGEGREHKGVPSTVESRVDTVAYNDPEALKSTFEAHGDEYACFILEPILGASGMIPATDEYLEAARDLTEAHDSLLIFDEVMSSRLSTGGAQQKRGVIPDLTTLGKYIGGGLPIGAFGGRTDVMNVFHPDEGDVGHSGTFNGNPATMAGVPSRSTRSTQRRSTNWTPTERRFASESRQRATPSTSP
ncbi:aspartate aminotransferase family protein [Haloplanus sp. GCM10025708]|uniref:aspartate aminotransferase family protein n=1 Tax=Haloplanus sp. GCM10025708 TaxID=3252679 RepID=UPI00360C68E4